MIKCVIEDATGLVVNIIEIEPDDAGTFDHWECPPDCSIRDIGGNAGMGWAWNGTEYVEPEEGASDRLSLLLGSPQYVPGDAFDPSPVLKDDATLEAEKAELLELLLAKLADPARALTTEETNILLRLEREL